MDIGLIKNRLASIPKLNAFEFVGCQIYNRVFFQATLFPPHNLLFYVIAFKLFSPVCQILQSFSFKAVVFFWVSNSVPLTVVLSKIC